MNGYQITAAIIYFLKTGDRTAPELVRCLEHSVSARQVMKALRALEDEGHITDVTPEQLRGPGRPILWKWHK